MLAFARRKGCKRCMTRSRGRLTGGFYRSPSKTGDARNRLTGGFYPSAMGSILTTGPLFVGAALFQGRRLLANNTKRMATRRRFQTTRKRARSG